MVEHSINVTNGLVTLDVTSPTTIWSWLITLNMWAVSLTVGVVLVGAYLSYRHKSKDRPNLRWVVPLISLISLNIFLLSTLTYLHWSYKIINILLYPHWTSAITIGAWVALLYTIPITIMVTIGILDAFPNLARHNIFTKIIRRGSRFYEKVSPFAVFLSIPLILHTAIIMAESTAMGLWQAPTELIQVLLGAFIAGSATLIFVSDSWSREAREDLSFVLAISILFSFLIYMGEYLFSFKSAEIEATLKYLHSGGEYNVEFWIAMTLGFVTPLFLSISNIKSDNKTLMRFAAILALIGLYLSKDVWLKIPQILPLS